MREAERLLAVIGAIFIIGLLAGCSYMGGMRNENSQISRYAQYYKGTRGIVTSFENLPSVIYYNGPQDRSNNQFVIDVLVQNRGASFSRGGVYLTGFTPDMLEFEGMDLRRDAVGACGLSIGSIGFGEIGGIFRCGGVGVSAGNGITNIRIDDVGKLVGDLSERLGGKKLSYFDPERFKSSVQFSHNPNGNNFVVNFDTAQANIDYFQHGRLFIAAFLGGIDFAKNNGREFLLEGNTIDRPGGEMDYIQYRGRIVDWPPGLNQMTQDWTLVSCYQYTTFADPIVCIDPDPASTNYKVCRSLSRTWSGGQGAPVAVTSVEQEPARDKVIFRINVRNVGPGTVYDAGQLEKCSPYSPDRATPSDLNVVYLGDVRVGMTGLRTSSGRGVITCSPMVIRLDPIKKTGTTTCTYPIEYQNIKSAYQTPLVIELWYGYSEVQRRQVILRRI